MATAPRGRLPNEGMFLGSHFKGACVWITFLMTHVMRKVIHTIRTCSGMLVISMGVGVTCGVIIANFCSLAIGSETLVETPLLLLTISPARKRKHHHKACYNKSKNNGKTIELREGDNTRQFQA